MGPTRRIYSAIRQTGDKWSVAYKDSDQDYWTILVPDAGQKHSALMVATALNAATQAES